LCARDEKLTAFVELESAIRAKGFWLQPRTHVQPWIISLFVSPANSCGRTIWIADAHRDDGKRFIVRADEN